MNAPVAQPSENNPMPAWAGRGALLLLALLALACLLRTVNLGGPSLWVDELASYEFAQQPLSLLWSRWMIHETTPPLYYSLLHVSSALLGSSEATLRSFSVLAGVLTVGIVFLLGRRVDGRKTGWVAAALCAVNPLQVAYSREARAYIFVSLAAAAVLLVVLTLLDEARTRPNTGRLAWLALLYTVLMAAALYLHTTTFALAALVNASFLVVWFRGLRAPTLAAFWVGANLAVLGAWSWWLRIISAQRRLGFTNILYIHKPTLSDGFHIVAQVYGAPAAGVVSAVLLVITLSLALIGLRRLRAPAALLLGICAAGTPLLLWLISQRTPILLDRTMLWAQLPYLVLVARGLVRLSSRRLQAAALMCLLVCDSGLSVHALRSSLKEPWRAAMAMVKQKSLPTDAILVDTRPMAIPVLYYCTAPACVQHLFAVDSSPTRGLWAKDLPLGQLVRPPELAFDLKPFARVWAIHRGLDAPESYIPSSFHLVSQISYSRFDIMVSLWER